MPCSSEQRDLVYRVSHIWGVQGVGEGDHNVIVIYHITYSGTAGPTTDAAKLIEYAIHAGDPGPYRPGHGNCAGLPRTCPRTDSVRMSRESRTTRESDARPTALPVAAGRDANDSRFIDIEVKFSNRDRSTARTTLCRALYVIATASDHDCEAACQCVQCVGPAVC